MLYQNALLCKTVKFENGMSPIQFAKAILSTLKTAKVVHAVGIKSRPDLHEFWDQVSDAMGDCVPISESLETGEKTGNKWLEIRYDSRIPNAYRYSKNAQPLHTDCSYESDPQDIIFFYCVSQASKGGETVFFDSHDLISILEQEDKNLLDDLCKIPICFSKGNDRKRKPVITFDELGPILTWNYFCVDASESELAKDLAERFHAFLQNKVFADQKIHPVRLLPGEAVFFQDERLLHGRNAFDASENNERFLWKAGIKLNTKTKI